MEEGGTGIAPTVFRYFVQGSADEPYLVTITLRDGQLTASCTCAAGEALQACKHRIGFLSGDLSMIADERRAEADRLLELAKGAEIFVALKAVQRAEEGLVQAKASVSKAKRALSRIMHEP